MTEQAAELRCRGTARDATSCGAHGLRLVDDPAQRMSTAFGSGEPAASPDDAHAASAQAASARMQLGTADLVTRVLSGDADAFEPLYRAHAGHVYALCLRMSGNPERARELVQDAFVRAWGQLGSYRGESAFGTWLHRVTVNVVLADFRRARRRDSHAITEADLVDSADLDWPCATIVSSCDDRMDLDTAIATLPAGARMAFVLYDIEGYSHAEISALTGLAAGTIRTHLFRARQLLMKALA